MMCEGNYETCPCDDCEAVRASPLPIGRPPIGVDLDEVRRRIDAAMKSSPLAFVIDDNRKREQLIADGFVSLVDVVGIIRRNGGFLRPEDQALLRQAEVVIAQAKVTP